MNCNIIVSSVFERSAKKLAKRYSSFRDDFIDFISVLKEDPFVGADLGHGLRKFGTGDRSLSRLITNTPKSRSGGVSPPKKHWLRYNRRLQSIEKGKKVWRIGK